MLKRNGPAELKPQARVSEFAPPAFDEAEHEIRRNIARHHAQVIEIAQLQTDLQNWQLRAKMAETEVERLTRQLAETQERADLLSAACATLRGQWQAGVQVWVNGFDVLNNLNIPQLHSVPPPQLQQQHSEDDPHDPQQESA